VGKHEEGSWEQAALVLPAVQPENEEILMLIMPMMLNDN